MRIRTRLVDFIRNSEKRTMQHFLLDRKKQWSRDSFTKTVCLLLAGFLIGNLFGTFLSTIRQSIAWDGLIVFILVSIIEIISYNVYHNKDRPFFLFVLYPKTIKRSFWRSFNLLKIGLMMGFFIDAFKVGS